MELKSYKIYVNLVTTSMVIEVGSWMDALFCLSGHKMIGNHGHGSHKGVHSFSQHMSWFASNSMSIM